MIVRLESSSNAIFVKVVSLLHDIPLRDGAIDFRIKYL